MSAARCAVAVSSAAVLLLHAAAADRPIAPPMAIGLSGVSSYGGSWTFVDLMKHSREWRVQGGALAVVEDQYGWPRGLRGSNGVLHDITPATPVLMYMYSRQITGDLVLAWDGDGAVELRRQKATLIEDNLPARNRRVYRWSDRSEGVYDVAIMRSAVSNPVRNIRLWMPGCENAASPFHPLFKERIKPFPYFRFMDWTATNNNKQREWAERVSPLAMRQTQGVAWEYVIALCNELDRDGWLCIPHQASDDYVRQLARLIRAQLKPGLRVYVEYSNEIWNPAFQQTQWLWQQARAEGHRNAPWEYGATLCGRRSAQLWAVMDRELGDPQRLVRVMTHVRWIDRALAAATNTAYGSGRVDLIGLNGYFISQDALQYALRSLDRFDLGRVFDDIEQMHLREQAMAWRAEITGVKQRWHLPVTCYEGGQHFANPFASGLQGAALVQRMFDVNSDRRIQQVYRTALETWHLAGADGFTAFVDCGSWSKYGCWGHLRYQDQPLHDVVDPRSGATLVTGAYKYVALLDYLARRSGQDAARAPVIATAALPDAAAGVPYTAHLRAVGGTPPYRWSLLGGRLPTGLTLDANGCISGMPTRAEQLVTLVDCTDAAGQHAARVLGLFMNPAAALPLRAVPFALATNALPAGWVFAGPGSVIPQMMRGAPGALPAVSYLVRGVPYYAASSGCRNGYVVEATFMPATALNIHARVGLAVNATRQGDPEDYLRIALDGLGRNVLLYSRYVAGGKGELWPPRSCPLLPDTGEQTNAPAFDAGEAWTLRVLVRPAHSAGAIDLLISVVDETGASRLDADGRNDVANGIWLQRELAPKEPLCSGPFGVLTTGVRVDRVRWAPLTE